MMSFGISKGFLALALASQVVSLRPLVDGSFLQAPQIPEPGSNKFDQVYGALQKPENICVAGTKPKALAKQIVHPTAQKKSPTFGAIIEAWIKKYQATVGELDEDDLQTREDQRTYVLGKTLNVNYLLALCKLPVVCRDVENGRYVKDILEAAENDPKGYPNHGNHDIGANSKSAKALLNVPAFTDCVDAPSPKPNGNGDGNNNNSNNNNNNNNNSNNNNDKTPADESSSGEQFATMGALLVTLVAAVAA